MDNFVENILQKMPFYNLLNKNEATLMLENTRITTIAKGEVVHSGVEECFSVIYVISGNLKVSIMSDEGREITLYKIGNDEFIISASGIYNNIDFDLFVVAESDTAVLQINADVWKNIASNNINLENFTLNIITNKFVKAMNTFKQILFMSFDKRLATFLISETELSNDMMIRYTHEQIACYIGSSREVVSRKLKQFEMEGIVMISRNGVKVKDRDKLLDILNKKQIAK